MSYNATLKALLWERTQEQALTLPAKQRLNPCCIHTFLTTLEEFGAPSLEHSQLCQSLARKAKAGHCADCDKLYLRAAFLCNGSMTDPQKGYHLEIVYTPGQKSALQKALEAQGIPFKQVTRGKKQVFYTKDSERLEDLLSILGLPHKALELMQTKVEKNVKNQINRLNNLDGANLQKTIYYAGRISDAIALLKQHDRFETLPESVKKTAILRKKYPGASLTELCRYCDEPITKSGLNHRLQKLMEEARQLEESLKNKEDTL